MGDRNSGQGEKSSVREVCVMEMEPEDGRGGGLRSGRKKSVEQQSLLH